MFKYRSFFPALTRCIYADTAAAGLISEQLLQWRREQDLDLQLNASAGWRNHTDILKDTRAVLGRFFKTTDSVISLVPNFSLGLNLLLENQDTRQKVLLIEEDYPSVNWPFERRGFNISYIKTSADIETRIMEEVSRKNIDILAISLVQWLDGLKINPEFIRHLKKEFPSLIIIADGTQYCGAFDLDFENSGIDVLGASGYKWLLAGYGNGFLLVRDECHSRFPIASVGFNSAEGNLDGMDTIRFCKQLEPGHLDSLNFGSLKFTVEMLSSIGMERIEAYNRSLLVKAMNEFGDMGLLSDTVMERKDHGSIFRLDVSKSVYEHLLHSNVRCSWRAGGLRLSFHFYNTEEEIDGIVEIVNSVL